MEPMSPIQNQPLLQQTPTKTLNEMSFKEFLGTFDPEQRKQFLNNLTRQTSTLISRYMRKMKEAHQKLKEAHQKK